MRFANFTFLRSAFTLLLSLSVSVAIGQTSLSGGGFEQWHGGFFAPGTSPSHGEKCCGAALAIPEGWGVPEQLMAMPVNQFTFKETDSTYIHSGNFSARLLTNITTMDSAGDVSGGLAVLVPGQVVCTGIVGYGALGIMGDLYKTIAYSTGSPFADTPKALNFYIKMSHDVPDTALYAHAFTRWDSVNMKEDTLAFHQVDIPDNNYLDGNWHLISDTISYKTGGLPDTLHLIFYGGRNGDSTKAGNLTWLDDVSFYYTGQGTNTGLVHLSADDAVSVYPNPASGELHVKIDDYMKGYTIELYDLRGNRAMSEILPAAMSSFSTGKLADGLYLYRLLDSNAAMVNSGKVTIAK